MAPITVYEALAVTLAGFAGFIVFVSAMNGAAFHRIMPANSLVIVPSSASPSFNSTTLPQPPSTAPPAHVNDCLHNLVRWATTRHQFHEGAGNSNAFYRPSRPSDVACTDGSRPDDRMSAFCRLNYHHIKRTQFSAIATLVLAALANVCACLHIWGCCRSATASFFLSRVVFWVTIVAAAFALQVRGRLGDWDMDASAVGGKFDSSQVREDM